MSNVERVRVAVLVDGPLAAGEKRREWGSNQELGERQGGR